MENRNGNAGEEENKEDMGFPENQDEKRKEGEKPDKSLPSDGPVSKSRALDSENLADNQIEVTGVAEDKKLSVQSQFR